METKKMFLDDCKKTKQLSFLHVRKHSNYYQLHDKVMIFDYAENYIGLFYIRSIKNLLLHEIDNSISFLASNVNFQLFRGIMLQKKGIESLDTIVSIIVFSTLNPLNEC